MLKANWRRIVIYLVISLVILLVGLTGYQAWHAYQLAVDLQAAASELQSLLGGDLATLDLSQVAPLVQRARKDAEGLHALLRPIAPITNALGWVPRFGPMIAAAAPMAEYAYGLTTAADELLKTLGPLLEDPSGEEDGAGSITERMADTLEESQALLVSAELALQTAADARDEFQLNDLPPSLQAPLAKVDRFLPLAQQGVRILQILPTLLGAEEPRTFVLMAQNHDELRATGGFISAVGTIVMEGGHIASLSIGDSYAVDDFSKAYPLPPEPLQRYMLAQQWLLRDANWSPDFPTAAITTCQLYELSTGSKVDGLVAFDQEALARLLSIVGPLTVADAPDPVGPDNIEGYMHQAWAPEPGEGLSREWWEHRKDFIGELGAAIVAKIQASSDLNTLMSLARVMVELMREKHLLIFIIDPSAMAALSELGWDNALRPGEGDFLMLVDSNVGFNKVDSRIERSIAYQIDLSDSSAPVASLSITYHNTVTEEVPCEHRATYGEGTYADLQTRCYWDYVRVYAPGGSELISGELPPVPGEWLLTEEDEPGVWSQGEGEAGTMSFGGIFVLPPSQEATLTLSYNLPVAVLPSRPDEALTYNLRIVKQPGTGAVPVRLLLIPPDGHVAVDEEGWEAQADGTLTWSGDLRTDIELSLSLHPISP